MSTACMKKVTCPIFDGHEYPKWKAMMKKRLMAMNSKLWTVTEIGLTDLCKTAEADDIRKYTLLNLTAKDIICSCLSKISPGTLCISVMRSLSGTDSLRSMKVIELTVIPGLRILWYHARL